MGSPSVTPPLPPGFQLESQTPPLPPGFEVEGQLAQPTPAEPPPGQLAAQAFKNIMDMGDVGKNFLSGMGGGALSTLANIIQIAAKTNPMPGHEKAQELVESVLNRPEVQKAIGPQEGPGGGLGRTVEQMAEFAVPVSRVAKAVEKAPLAARMAAEALTSGGVAGVQTGGEPTATSLATVLGAAGPAASKALQAVKGLSGAPTRTSNALNRSQPGALVASPDAEALELARREAIPVPTSVATGNRFAKAAEQIGGQTVLGSGIAKRAQEQTAQAMTRTSERLAERAHPLPVVPETAGSSLTGRLESRISRLRQEAEGEYSKFDAAAEDPRNIENVQLGTRQLKSRDAAGKPVVVPEIQQMSMPVDVRDLKTDLKKVFDKLQWLPVATRNSSAGYTAVKRILEGPDFVPATSAERGLSGLKELAREAASSDLRTESQGIAAGIVPKLQARIDAVAAKAGVLSDLRAGRTAHSLKMAAADVLKKLRDEPVQAFQQATYANDAGINQLRELKKWAPAEMQVVGRGYLEKLFETAKAEGAFGHGQNLWSQWRKLGPQTKNILFPNPILRRDLDAFFTLGRKLSEVPNPSGTAPTLHAMGQIGWMFTEPMTGVAYTLGTGAMTKLLYSPSGARVLQRAMQASKKIASGAPSRVHGAPITALLARVGDEAQPVTENKKLK